MSYLRNLSNSFVAAMLGSCYVLILFLELNPRLPLTFNGVTALASTVGMFYVLHLTAITYIALVIRQVFARSLFSPAWVSVSLLSWLGTILAAVAAGLIWANLLTFGIVLAPETNDAMVGGAITLAIAAVLFAGVALGRRTSRPKAPVWAISWSIVAIGSVVIPVVLRGPARVPPLEARPLDTMMDVPADEGNSHVTILAIDAGSLELITRATAEGRLPNFGRILDAGAVMHLATLHPTSAEAVWSAVATGKLPQKNGVRSGGIYHLIHRNETIRVLPNFCFANVLVRFGILVDEPHTSASIRTRPFWSILSLQGVSVGLINWPLTYPAPLVRGYVVSDRYSRLAQTTAGIEDQSMLYPPELRREVLPVSREVIADPEAVVQMRSDTTLPDRYQQTGRIDVEHERLADTLNSLHPTRVTVVRYQCLDTIGHYFLRYAMPAAFGDVSDEERTQLGSVLESHYGLIDEAIGRAIAALGPEDLLLIVSGYGMEPLGFGKRILERVIGDPDISGTHETAPDGFLMAYGASISRGRLRRASVVDVVPTLLYFLGLPIGRDMDGYARTDLFQSAFTEERPVTLIPTYDR